MKVMSILVVRCPNCGASTVPSVAETDKYDCMNCGNKGIQLIRPGDATVVSDSKTHYCRLCGSELGKKAVHPLRSFRCTQCQTPDFCEHCVSPVPNFGVERFVCRACLSEKGWACGICEGFGASECVNCGRRACQQHLPELFGLIHRTRDEDDTVTFYNCENCGQLCTGCLQAKRGLFSKKYCCPKCGTQIHPDVRWLSDFDAGFEMSKPRKKGGEKNA